MNSNTNNYATRGTVFAALTARQRTSAINHPKASTIGVGIARRRLLSEEAGPEVTRFAQSHSVRPIQS